MQPEQWRSDDECVILLSERSPHFASSFVPARCRILFCEHCRHLLMMRFVLSGGAFRSMFFPHCTLLTCLLARARRGCGDRAPSLPLRAEPNLNTLKPRHLQN